MVHKSEGIKLREDLIKRWKTLGARSPFIETEILPPSHSYTKAMIKKYQADIDLDRGIITKEKFYKEHEEADKVINKMKKLVD
jgi:hypothetical protein